jgi:hypothetical protein
MALGAGKEFAKERLHKDGRRARADRAGDRKPKRFFRLLPAAWRASDSTQRRRVRNGRAANTTSRWKPMFDATSPSDHGDDLSSFELPEVRPRNPSDKDLQRAEGSGIKDARGAERCQSIARG